MAQRNSFLPAVNGGRASSFSMVRAVSSSQKQRYSAAEFTWKNPSTSKTQQRPDRMEGGRKCLGEQQSSPESFLGYDISSPKMTERSKRNRAIEISEFVRGYVGNRESQLPPLKTPQRSLIKRNKRPPDCFFIKTKSKEISLPSLQFNDEVISCRGDPCLSSYFSTDMKKLYKLKDLPVCKQRKKKDKSKANAKGIFPQKHKLCMPSESSKQLSAVSNSKYFWRKELEEKNLVVQAGKSTHLWEKYVLGLISKQTAQWIANQCSTGEQRGRLISFLDEKYKIENAERDGTATVFKLLCINDDAVSPPNRRDKQTIVGSETLHSDT